LHFRDVNHKIVKLSAFKSHVTKVIAQSLGEETAKDVRLVVSILGF